MFEHLLAAFALMLVLEGLLPLLTPRTWRETFRRIAALEDGQIRFCGLIFIVLGILLMVLFPIG